MCLVLQKMGRDSEAVVSEIGMKPISAFQTREYVRVKCSFSRQLITIFFEMNLELKELSSSSSSEDSDDEGMFPFYPRRFRMPIFPTPDPFPHEDCRFDTGSIASSRSEDLQQEQMEGQEEEESVHGSSPSPVSPPQQEQREGEEDTGHHSSPSPAPSPPSRFIACLDRVDAALASLAATANVSQETAGTSASRQESAVEIAECDSTTNGDVNYEESPCVLGASCPLCSDRH